MAYHFNLPLITQLTIGQQAALNETNAISISGGPGTGKSVVSLWRHIRNYATGSKKSLLLTYTKTLEYYLKATAKSEDANAAVAVNRTYRWTYQNRNAVASPIYDEIIVDEAQDVEHARYEILKKYTNAISYGADDQQSVYPDKATSQRKLEELFPNNNRYFLDENFRNSYEIMRFSKGLFPGKVIQQSALTNLLEEGRRGPKPVLLVSNHDKEKENQAIIDVIEQFRSATHNIAILVPLQHHVNQYANMIREAGIECSKFSTDDGDFGEIDNVHVTTFKSSKGAEFDTVIIPDFGAMMSNISNLRVIAENDYYVGITRAKRNLYLISAFTPGFMERSAEQKSTYSKEIL